MKHRFTWNIRALYFLLLIPIANSAFAQGQDPMGKDKFKQLYEEFPTPNEYRTASGAPGHAYWQNRANYVIKVVLDDKTQSIFGEETITYLNESPDELTYLWVQLDQNINEKNSDAKLTRTEKIGDRVSANDIIKPEPLYDGGFKIETVRNSDNSELKHTIVKTMMRIDLTSPLASKKTFTFKIKYHYQINDRDKVGGRSGFEYFKAEDNCIYTIAQFFPRMAVYHDAIGWQHKQFLGGGEFTLPFGNYEVQLTVPSDHLVAATGELVNPSNVLNPTQLKRLEQARKSFKTPIVIQTQAEAIQREGTKSTSVQTWIFKAHNVRDFAFATSRKFIWDAMAVKLSNGKTTMAMSMYPKEGNPLWGKFSTKAVAHTLKTYSQFTIDYPYPYAWSINTKNIGMEYPMICFNGGRCDAEGNYSESTKYSTITVIIHEVGHNFFPMIINSDERQWTWMDEGLNTFLQYLTEQQWEREYPSSRGPAYKIADYMKGDAKSLEPIMTNSESLSQFGNNAYGKPAAALNILRETVMGRELFDFAFKTYAERWAFKHPTPADFFRTMEDASGIDLDWFWRGWFYTTEHVDQSIASVKWMKPKSDNPDLALEMKKQDQSKKPQNISEIRYAEQKEAVYAEIDTDLVDKYSASYKKTAPVAQDKYDEYKSKKEQQSPEESQIATGDWNLYELTIKNVGDLVMPIIIKFEFADGSSDISRIPVEIWRYNTMEISKVFTFPKEVVQISLDPYLELADTDLSNNYYPEKALPSRFDLYKTKSQSSQKVEAPSQRQRKTGSGN